jgi:hypothetical protein
VTPWPGQAGSVSTYLVVWQNVTAWGSGPGALNDYSFHCGPSYGYPCYSYSGSGAVSLERVASDLVLTADSTVVAPGSTITFSISQTKPFVLNGADTVWLPLEGVKAIWIPEDSVHGGARSESPDSVRACTFIGPLATKCSRVIAGSGTLTYVAIVNGIEQRKSLRVIARSLTCQIGFPEIDDPAVDLPRLWRDSHMGPGEPRADRREAAAYVLERSDGGRVLDDSGSVAPALCTFSLRRPPPVNAVAMIHVHTSHRGDSQVELCEMGENDYPKLYEGSVSDMDFLYLWATNRLYNMQLRGFMLDSDGIVMYELRNLRPFQRRFPRCGY